MQFELPFHREPSTLRPAREQMLKVAGRNIRLHLISNRRARRYVLRLQNDGSARVTVPRRGSAQEAARFAARNVAWLEKQLLRQSCETNIAGAWHAGSNILFRGEFVSLQARVNGEHATVQFGPEIVPVTDPSANLRPELESYLWKMSARELSARTLELARLHSIAIGRVTVRNQRSRWGSCSRRGTISLNWRLVHAPLFVRDYIILHELAHVKEMNHSRRFWGEVERLCPNYREAEHWLRKHSSLLR